MAEQKDIPVGKVNQIIAIAIVVPVAAAVIAFLILSPGRKGAVGEEVSAGLIQPVARFEYQAAAGGAKGARTGEQVVQAICAACHQSGAAGAPKIGDKGAWASRIAQGLDALVKSAVAGKGAMPP